VRRPTAAVLIVGALLGVGVLLLRRDARVEEVPRRKTVPLYSTAPSETTPAEPSDPPTIGTPPAPPPSVSPVASDPQRPGVVRGRVEVRGPAPRRKRSPLEADPRCQALHAEPLYSDTLVRAPDNHVRWAFVRVKSGLEGRTFVAPSVPVTLAQIGCRYEPHVLGVQVGQPLVIVNHDPLLHNIHAFPFINQAFNFGQPTPGAEETKTFSAPEIFSVRCDVHPWMSAWIAVVEHPYYAVTDGAGRYALPEMLPGPYVLEAWHESCAPVSRRIDLTGGDGVELDFVLDLRK